MFGIAFLTVYEYPLKSQSVIYYKKITKATIHQFFISSQKTFLWELCDNSFTFATTKAVLPNRAERKFTSAHPKINSFKIFH